MCSVAHSIPESNALIIRTPLGTVLHTGDWKLDPTPVLGPPTDEAKLRALGDEGCLALIGDSTNAVREGRSPSEADVAKTLAELIANAPRRVAVTTFASNVARMRAVAEAARGCGPRGRGGRPRHGAHRRRSRARPAISTACSDFRSAGCLRLSAARQGGGALHRQPGRAARGARRASPQDEHPEVTLRKGDRVIFSSRAIPGNEKAIGRVINGLIDQGIEVITDRTHLVHVSGHPRRAELEEMIGWVRPQIVIPVHGEALHLAEHAALARALGVPAVDQCRNGDLVRLAPGEPGIIDEVPAGRLYKDGALLVDAAGAHRRRPPAAELSPASSRSRSRSTTRASWSADPEVELIGIPERDRRRRADARRSPTTPSIETLRDAAASARRRDPDAVAEAVRRAVRAAHRAALGQEADVPRPRADGIDAACNAGLAIAAQETA